MNPAAASLPASAAERARFVREHLPDHGLFAGHEWRVSPTPFAVSVETAKELETLGRVLLQFNKAVNRLYRLSVEGKQPSWVAAWLDLGKPAELIALQRSPGFKNEWPRVIRPDLLITDTGLSVTELDSVPGGIGLTAWLSQTYAALAKEGPAAPPTGGPASDGDGQARLNATLPAKSTIGGADGMLRGFASIFGDAKTVHLVISEEATTYRPEMQWLTSQLDPARFKIQPPDFTGFADGDAVYRFFELFDAANVPSSKTIFDLAVEQRIRLTPPPKPLFEEKMLFALLWNRNLRGYWRQELGEGFLNRMLKLTPYAWLVDPAPLPPHGAIPELNLTEWNQLKSLSQRERELILKVSGYSPKAWGARGVYLGNDLSHADWSEAVDTAIASFPTSPHILQRYQKTALVDFHWFDFAKNELVPMPGRVRLSPYYFVSGDGDEARATLGGVLATVCPANKKIIHGMTEAVFAPGAIAI